MQVVQKKPTIFGALGKGLGEGIASQLPKEVERSRLSGALQELGKQKGNTPYENFTGLVQAAHEYPQIIQSGERFLTQQAIRDSVREGKQPQNNPSQPPVPPKGMNEKGEPTSITTTSGNYSKQNPYIPPAGEDQEYLARKKLYDEPLIYPNIESARAAVQNEIAGNTNRSNSEINAENLKVGIQSKAEEELLKNINRVGANIPGRIMQNINQQALKDVKDNKLSPEAAGTKYAGIADEVSESFSNLGSLGGLSLVTKNKEGTLNSIENIRKTLKGIQGGTREGINYLISEGGFTPNLSGALMNPVKEHKSLNNYIKSLPEVKSFVKSAQKAAKDFFGVAGQLLPNYRAIEETRKIAPELADAMGKEGSPLAVAHEIEKLGYDPDEWKKYLIDNKEDLNLANDQTKELDKGPLSYFSGMNDWLLRSFSGIK